MPIAPPGARDSIFAIPSETLFDRPGPPVTPDAPAKRAGGGLSGLVEKILEFYNYK